MACIGRITALGLAGTLLLTPGLRAQREAVPTVAVVGFLAESDSRLSVKAIDAMADGLALQLVESGRYRVLDRVWLGVESGAPKRTPLARLRDAAKGAGVDYLIVGHVSKMSEVHRNLVPAARTLPPFGTPRSSYLPMTYGTRAKRIDTLRVSIELVDVTTGSVLTETSSNCAMPPKSGMARTAPMLLLPAAPLAAAAALVARSQTASSGLDPGLERAMTNAGQALIRWNPPASVSR